MTDLDGVIMKEKNKSQIEQTCPVCEEGVLLHKQALDKSEYKGVIENIPLFFSECSACGSELADANVARANKREMLAFKKRVDHLLSADEIKLLRKRYGMTQQQAAKIFGGGPVAFSKYEANDVMQSDSMDKLLRLARKFPVGLAWLAKEAGEFGLESKIVFMQMQQVKNLLARHRSPFSVAGTFKASGSYESVGLFSEMTFSIEQAANDETLLEFEAGA